MSKFALKKITAVVGKQSFDQLLVNGVAPLDEFEKDLQAADKKSMQKIYLYMNDVSNNLLLPKQKFRDITPKKERVKEYEFKSESIRVYAIGQKGGKIVIICGYKSNQKKDIIKFRSIKKQYLDALKEENDDTGRTIKK